MFVNKLSVSTKLLVNQYNIERLTMQNEAVLISSAILCPHNFSLKSQ